MDVLSDRSREIQSAVLPYKVSHIRWCPKSIPRFDYEQPQSFVTGSWDTSVNSITLWSSFHNSSASEDELTFESGPEVLAEKLMPGDITGLEFFNKSSSLACATSKGSVSILNIEQDMSEITEKYTCKTLHTINGENVACTGLSVFNESIATVGEDGCLNIVTSNTGQVVRSIKNDDYCGFGCVSYVSPDMVLVSYRHGNIECYDMRQDTESPVMGLSTQDEDDQESKDVTCMACLPCQSRIVFGGLENGSILSWDLRMFDVYTASIRAHDFMVNDIAFLKNNSQTMFSATRDGEVFQWLLDNYWTSENYFDDLEPSYSSIFRRDHSINSIDIDECFMIFSCDDTFVFVLDTVGA